MQHVTSHCMTLHCGTYATLTHACLHAYMPREKEHDKSNMTQPYVALHYIMPHYATTYIAEQDVNDAFHLRCVAGQDTTLHPQHAA